MRQLQNRWTQQWIINITSLWWPPGPGSIGQGNQSHSNELIGNFKNISLILRHLSLPNNYLTRVPPEIRLFPNVRVLNFRNNRIVKIKEDNFKFYNSTRIRINREDPVFLDLGDNLINYIEAGAFEGICGHSKYMRNYSWDNNLLLNETYTYLGDYFDGGSTMINLDTNKLIRFQSDVFESVLE